MGTSRTNDGPGDRIPLLPAWALPGGEPPQPPDEPEQNTEDGSGDPGIGPENGGSDQTSRDESATQSNATPVSQAQPPPSRWQAAKRRLTQSARSGGGRANVSAAARTYVRAKGGARAAAATAIHGRATASRAGRFFGALLSSGLAAALDTLGIRNYIGRSADVVFTAIANAIAPPGATLEQAAARRASDDVLAKLYDELIDADGDLTPLEHMTEKDVADAFREVIISYVYERWLEELGKSIETGAVSASDAVRFEREVKQYVRDIVDLDVKNEDILSFGQEGKNAQDVIERLFEEAYGFLEDGR
jgi:hypothetical protein